MEFAVKIPFATHLGFRLQVFEGGNAEITYEVAPEHENSFGVAHGGACMTLLDITMASAARSVHPEMGTVTIEMKTSFMQPARGLLTAKGRLIHRTTSLAFTEATIYDSRGRACAHATGTFKYVRRQPTAKGISTD